MATVPLKRLVDPARPITYGIVQAGEDVAGGVRYIRPVDMDGHRGVDPDALRTTSPETGAAYARSSLKPGDVVMSIGPSFGKTMVVPEELNGANLTQGTARVAVQSDVHARYIVWALQSQTSVDFWETSIGGATFRALNLGPLAETPIPVPSLEEQHTIASYLDRETARIDTLIEEQMRLIELLRERRIAVLAALMESLGGMTRLKHVSTVQTGVTLNGEGDPAAPEWPYLRVANVQVGYMDLREIKSVRVPLERAAASMLQPGDVLMTEGGDIDKLGRGALWRGEVPNMLHQNHIFAVRPSEVLDPEFLVYWLDGPIARTYFRTTAKQTTNLAGTNKWTLGNLPVPVPPVVEQRRAVEALDEETTKISALIAETERFIGLARERRSALITAAVTGQIDVQEMV
ncbi:restriction endonuclease subunit S [Glycomyces harbinensis]|uniref:Type I restriction enzyme, S subunit n=1 Tax=Glycomyces harbinensis TaxID=58114 RepID=A0A1G7B2H4_9ACTN|nr:restriction endonuclease subunit S [Glycomyces harbinensis]SDE20445.1 type I restriction enzyme, S subunit [Glycomyces harbinensis]